MPFSPVRCFWPGQAAQHALSVRGARWRPAGKLSLTGFSTPISPPLRNLGEVRRQRALGRLGSGFALRPRVVKGARSFRLIGARSAPSSARRHVRIAGVGVSVSVTLSPREEREAAVEKQAVHRRRKSVQQVREARDRLTYTSGTRPAFDAELLRLFAQNRMSGSLVILMLVGSIGILSSFWTGSLTV